MGGGEAAAPRQASGWGFVRVFDPLQIKRREQLLLARPAAGYILQHQDRAGSVTGLQVNATE